MQSREDIRKFLNFYKRKNSVCVDLYQPAFYTKKPNWEDLAEFVYSVLSVGSKSAPAVIRAAVKDVQLHPVKKLLFIKFSAQQIRDEVASRLQAGLVWPAFDTSVSGWAMDKPVERFRVLGASPETDEAGVRLVLQKYGEVLDAKKGLISPKKLPGCSNGIWTVKMILEKDQTLPPFLIMKEEGEVWQLATGEVSVCWKCGLVGHIGDKCFQDVSALAASLVGPTVSNQPSWAHVVRGAKVGPPQLQLPIPPTPPKIPHPEKMCVPVTPGALQVALSKLVKVNTRIFAVDYDGVNSYFRDEYVKAQAEKKAKALELTAKKSAKVKAVPADDSFVDGEILSKIEESQVLVKPSDAVHGEDGKEIDVDKDDGETPTVSMEVEFSPVQDFNSVYNKKSKLSRSDAPGSSNLHPGSPDLPHKLPSRVRSLEEEKLSDDEGSDEVREGVHTNMFGVKYLMWFDLSIEGKSALDREEQDWGGKLEFGFSDTSFSKDIKDYFLLFEDQCSLPSHHCAARVMGVASNMLDRVLDPPSYDPRSIVSLLNKYSDAHIIDSG